MVDLITYGTATGGTFLRSLSNNEDFLINQITGDAHLSKRNNLDYHVIENPKIDLNKLMFDCYVQIVVPNTMLNFLAIRLLHINSYSINLAENIYNSQKAESWPEFPGNNYLNWSKDALHDIIAANKQHLSRYSKNLNTTSKIEFLIDATELYKDVEPVTIKNWLKQIHSKELNLDRLKLYRKINYTIIKNIGDKLLQKFELQYEI